MRATSKAKLLLFSVAVLLAGAAAVGGGSCGDAFTPIYTIQGSGTASPIVGTTVTTEGVVIGDFQGANNLKGFYIQDPTGDGNTATSDGIFVFDGAAPAIDVSLGDRVRVTGTVSEQFNNTQINPASSIIVCSTGNPLPAPVSYDLPEPVNNDLERVENMLVAFPETLTVTGNFTQGRFGEVVLSSEGRLFQQNNFDRPNSAGALAVANLNQRRYVVLDDGRSIENPDPTPYFDANNTRRVGDTVTGLTGVLTFDLSEYRVQPTVTPIFTSANPRTAAPLPVGSTIKASSFNVLNYFNGDGAGGGFPTTRGASTLAEFNRQRDKIIAAIVAIDADIYGIIAIENDGNTAASAIQDLVNGLNTATALGTYAFTEGTTPGTDEIKNSIIYKTSTVTPDGVAINDTDAIWAGQARNPLAQTFALNSNGAKFVFIVNHFTSKACSGSTGLDLDQGDGQGCNNLQRTLQADALLDFVEERQTASGEARVLVMGDLNSYGEEDPIFRLEDDASDRLVDGPGGLIDQVQRFVTLADRYSYQADHQSGYLDHALASKELNDDVSGTTIWHINADEPTVLDYNVEFKSAAQQAINVGTPYRASDHDPVIVGLLLPATECTPPPADMVGWWPGDGNANDIRGLNDGTPQGNTTFVAGEVDQAFSFDGTGDSVSTNLDAQPSAMPSTTWDAWVYPTRVNHSTRQMIMSTDDAGFDRTVLVESSTSNFAVFTGSGSQQTATVDPNQWQHIAVVYQQDTGGVGTVTFYKNGVSFGPYATTGQASNNGFTIGRNAFGPQEHFQGLIDEVEVFNRALCAADILAIYNAGSAGKCKPRLNVDFNSNNPGPSFSATQTGFIAFDVADGTSTFWSLPVTGLDLATAPTGNAAVTVQGPNPIFSRDRAATPPNSGAFNFSDLYRDVITVAVGPFTISLTGLAPNTIFDVTFYASDQGVSSSNIATFANTTNGGSVPSGSVTYGPPVTSNHQFSVRLRVISNASGALTFSETSAGPQGGPVLNAIQVAPVPTANACPSPTPAALQLLNISARASVGTGDNVSIGGFIIQGDAGNPVHERSPQVAATTKRVLIRGLGPSLPVVGSLEDPVLTLHDSNGAIIASNDNWKEDPPGTPDPVREAAINATGLEPNNDLEAALVATLDTDTAHTAILRGKNGGTGIGLVEIYDLEPFSDTHLVNLSTRAFVSTGDDVLIGGIIVGGGNTQMILFRAIGPSLPIFVDNPLLDPQLELHDAQGTLIAHNDNWKEEPDGTLNGTREAQINATGLGPNNNAEAAILYVAPPPGNYTAIVSGVGGTTGVGMVEVYRLGPPPGP